MSHANFAAAFEPAEARYRSQVAVETWGHLAPNRGRTYVGYIVFAVGCFGDDNLNPTAIECEFKNLDSSPWFYDALTDLIGSFETEAGGVYRWEGTFRNYEFVGKLVRLRLASPDETQSSREPAITG